MKQKKIKCSPLMSDKVGKASPHLQQAGQASGADEPSQGYEVGYCKPPVSSQFKQGQSGNPKGKAKGTKNGRTIHNNECDVRLEVTENGRKRKFTKRELVYKATINNAIKGDPRATTTFYKLEDKHASADETSVLTNSPSGINSPQRSEMDMLILRHFNVIPASDTADLNGSPQDIQDSQTSEPAKRSKP